MAMKSETELFCNNCGKHGHLFYICKIPITSIGVISFRIVNSQIQYLMIRRKDTLGYVDFMRGKFLATQKQCVMNMLSQMTIHEKELLMKKYDNVKNGNRTNIKDKILEVIDGVYHSDICGNRVGYDLKDLIEQSNRLYHWTDPEWGFPKGRRNANECDYDCAVREFSEETGYSVNSLKNIRNIVPFEETFTGSNYNSYRHKYYVMYVPFDESIKHHKYQKTEVSSIEWFTIEECLENIRPYNLEKKKVIENVHACLQSIVMFSLNKK
jgi:8-oxo-dGTP pyrophosphatase MutT (NUDIX family)